VKDLWRDTANAAMERYSRGDEAAFAELYDELAPRLLRFLRRATRDTFAAEDLMQQTLLHMHHARGSFIAGSPVMPWALAIARRLMTDRARRYHVERRIFWEPSADDCRSPGWRRDGSAR
jgi:RNA polymerase sigma-70 factor (ECF subfamily)